MATQRLPAEERHRQIRRAAIRVFAERGFHGATTRRIAEEAAVAEALIYRYFPSKKALFIEALQHTSARMISGLEALLEAHGDHPATCLAELIAFYRRVLERNQDLAKMVFLVSAELDDPEILAAYRPHQDQALTLLEAQIARWQASGLLNAHLPTRAAAWTVLGTFQTIALMKHSGRIHELDEAPSIRMVRAFLQLDDRALTVEDQSA